MSQDRGNPVVALTAASQFDCSVERNAFAGTDVEIRPVDVSTRDDLAALSGVDADEMAEIGIEKHPFEGMLVDADVVSVHAPAD